MTALHETATPEVVYVVPPNIHVVQDFTFLARWWDETGTWVGPDDSGLDIETEGVVNPHDGAIATVQLAFDDECWVVHLSADRSFGDTPGLHWFRSYLAEEAVCKVIHNSSFERKWLMHAFDDVDLLIEPVHDTILAEYILAEGHGFGTPTSISFDPGILSLGDVVIRRYGVMMDKDAGLRTSFRRKGLSEVLPPAKDPLPLRREVCDVPECSTAPVWLRGQGSKELQVCDDHVDHPKLKRLRRRAPIPPRPVSTVHTYGDLTPRQVLYAAFDAQWMLTIVADQRQELCATVRPDGRCPAVELFELECRTAEAIARMEYHGVPINRQAVLDLHMTWSTAIRRVENQLQALLRPTPDAPPINLASVPQMSARLNDLGIGVPSYEAKHLRRFKDNPIVDRLLRWKMLTKLVGTYTKPFLEKRNNTTGRIYAGFNQTITATGRLSSSNPNFQNIPSRSKESAQIRNCVEAPPGMTFVIADYSNIEMRLIAEHTGDATMIQAFNEGKDLHVMTGARTLGVSYEEMEARVKAKEPAFVSARTNAKPTNFGLGYGAGWRKLQQMAWDAYGLDWDDATAQSQRQTFFSLYPGIAAWHKRVGKEIELGQGVYVVENVLGRRRVLPRHVTLADGATMTCFSAALNFPIQSASAEMTKRAMVALMRKVQLVLQVHDELVVVCREEEAEAVKGLVEREMLASSEGILVRVPNAVDAKISKVWTK
jgi:DNA polymerase I-like protein with 3'-5' exonuclease and polymerase domains